MVLELEMVYFYYRSLKLVHGPSFFKIVANNLPLVTQINGIEKL